MKTVIELEVEHSEKLPENLTDELASRAWQIVTNSQKCDVTVRRMEVKQEEDRPWL